MKKINIFTLILMLFFFIYSMAIISPYVSGDQLSYRNFYDATSGLSLYEAFELSAGILNAYEPISITVLWLGAQLGVNKDIYISLLNTLLLTLLFLFLIKNNTKPFVIFLFFTNFYIVVLMTGAEKLKISYILLFLGVVINSKANVFYFLLSPLAHFQSSILLLSAFVGKLDESVKIFFRSLRISKRSILHITSFILVAIIFYVVFSVPLKSKVESYLSGDVRLSNFYQLFILAIIGIYLAENKLKIILISLSVMPFIAALGGSRVNMIFFSLVIYILIIEKKHNSFMFMALMIYMSIKSIPFVINIYVHGNGFFEN